MNNPGQVTLSQVERALADLGGQAKWKDILKKITELRNNDYSYYRDLLNYETTAYQVIQQHCLGYSKYTGPTRFEKIGNTFRLSDMSSGSTQSPSRSVEVRHTPVAADIKDTSPPERTKQETYRILRDTLLARTIKESNNYRCQICGQSLMLNDNTPYAEAHHIKPLGAPHNGPDVYSNILCVCPNHHVLLDYGAIKLNAAELKGIGKEYIEYHNKNIYGKSFV
jgi:hypothetical protein